MISISLILFSIPYIYQYVLYLTLVLIFTNTSCLFSLSIPLFVLLYDLYKHYLSHILSPSSPICRGGSSPAHTTSHLSLKALAGGHKNLGSTLYHTALHASPLTAIHCTTLHCTVLNYTTIFCTALHCKALHSITLNCYTQHCTKLYCT